MLTPAHVYSSSVLVLPYVFPGVLPWSDYAVVGPDHGLRPLSSEFVGEGEGKLALSQVLSVLGSSAISALCPLQHIMHPARGQTAYVSGAAGSVGVIVCQLLKRVYGCRVIGSAGTKEKVVYLRSNDVGLDAAFNYKDMSTTEALQVRQATQQSLLSPPSVLPLSWHSPRDVS